MLFRKKHPHSCSYCRHGASITDSTVLCCKCGVVATDGSCRKFSYDPFKRIPLKAKPINTDKYKDEDYLL